jgi:hypothetical protein
MMRQRVDGLAVRALLSFRKSICCLSEPSLAAVGKVLD